MAGLCNITKEKRKITLWPLLMDGVQLSQGYRATTRRQFIFLLLWSSWYSFDRPRKDERQFFLKPPSGFKPGAPGLGLQHLNH